MGWRHVASLYNLEHILLLAAVCITCTTADWKRLVLLASIFTLTHLIASLPGGYGVLRLSPAWSQFLLLLVIIILSIQNFFSKKNKNQHPLVNYMVALFGLVHGLDYARYFNAPGGLATFAKLMAVHSGFLSGFVLVMCIVLLLNAIFLGLVKTNRREYIVFVSGAIFGIALHLILRTLPF